MKRFDYYKAAVCTPPVSIGDPKTNVDEMLRILQSLDPDTQLAVFRSWLSPGIPVRICFMKSCCCRKP